MSSMKYPWGKWKLRSLVTSWTALWKRLGHWLKREPYKLNVGEAGYKSRFFSNVWVYCQLMKASF